MLARVMRVRTAPSPAARVAAGNTTDFKLSMGFCPKGVYPEDGKIPRPSAMNRINMMPSQKSGIEMPTTPSVRASLSAPLPRCVLAATPSGMAMTIDMSIATAASSTVTECA